MRISVHSEHLAIHTRGLPVPARINGQYITYIANLTLCVFSIILHYTIGNGTTYILAYIIYISHHIYITIPWYIYIGI